MVVIRCNAECQCCPQRPHRVQGNVLRSTKGIQLLPHLEELDLRCNLIASIHEVVRLSGDFSVLLQRQLHDASTGTQHVDQRFSDALMGTLMHKEERSKGALESVCFRMQAWQL